MRRHRLGLPLTAEPDPMPTDAQECQAAWPSAVVVVRLGVGVIISPPRTST